MGPGRCHDLGAMHHALKIVVIAGLLTACGPGSAGTTIIASSPGTLTMGPQRVVAIVADQNQDLIGGPDLSAIMRLSRDEAVVSEAPAEWVWAIEDVRGFYTATIDFSGLGRYEIEVMIEGATTTAAPIDVVDDSPIPGAGDDAPRSDTRTTEKHSLSEITTDENPDPSFYDTSVAEAVTAGRPSVIVFATPAFCQTASCGPTLDVAKEVARSNPEVDFVHVEIFENIDDPTGELIEVPAIAEWGLFTEPWAFVVDAEGVVVASFEGAVGPNELQRAIAGIE